MSTMHNCTGRTTYCEYCGAKMLPGDTHECGAYAASLSEDSDSARIDALALCRIAVAAPHDSTFFEYTPHGDLTFRECVDLYLGSVK